jgi:hypothetical protein
VVLLYISLQEVIFLKNVTSWILHMVLDGVIHSLIRSLPWSINIRQLGFGIILGCVLDWVIHSLIRSLPWAEKIWQSGVTIVIQGMIHSMYNSLIESFHDQGAHFTRDVIVEVWITYRENPKIGNYPSSACPYNKCKIIHAGRVGQFPIFGYSLY